MDTSGVKTRFGRTIRTLLEVKQETEFPFIVGTVILVFLSIFKKTQALSPYEELNSVCLSRGQRDVRTPVQMTQKPTAFTSVSTWHTGMPPFSEIKDEPEFMPLLGNRAFF